MKTPSPFKNGKQLPAANEAELWETLNKQYQFLTSIIDEVADPILVIGTDFRVKYANRAACNFVRDNACIHATEPFCYRLIFDSDRPCAHFGRICPLIEVLENDKPATIEIEHTMSTGQTRFFEVHAAPLNSSDGDFLGIVESFRDVTERNQYAAMLQKGHQELERNVYERTEELIKSNEILGEQITRRREIEKILRGERDKFHSMLMATKQGMHIINNDYKIEFQNAIISDLLGDKIGHSCYELYKRRSEPCPDCLMMRAADTNEIQIDKEVHTDKGRYFRKSYAPFQDIDGKRKCLVLFNDITEMRAYEAKKIRTSQLASIGELAAGVAHEINNPINGIINYAQIILDDKEDMDTINSLLPRIIREGERIADIVSKLLSFARQGEDDSRSFAETFVQETLENSLCLVRHQLLKDGIQIAISIQPDTPTVWVHPQQLEQVLINLLSNARYALNQKFKEKSDDKRLELKVNTVEMLGTTYVRISIKDYGTGIPKEIVNFICNPFFSTKESGEGTGLGLSISQGLIKNFNGFLRINSEPGEFTNIVVDLPTFKGAQHDGQ
ncbi:MAG: PAS domain-containing protein [Desulfobulbaceae bacterium]|nr:PAS domain-containing protein [Desulfobulbaceae bacterium]